MDINLGTAIIVGGGWMISLCLHEFAHALVAYAGGDTSVKDKGYLTLNPLKYTDIGLTLIIPLIILMIGGIALPGAAVYINHSKLRNRFWNSFVSLAGPLANVFVLIVIAMPFLLGMSGDSDSYIWPSLALLALFQAVAIILNLLPIPPMDGYGIIEPWLPTSVRIAANKFARVGIWVLFAALWYVKPLNMMLWGSAYWVMAYLEIPPDLIERGQLLFQKQSFLLIGCIIGALLISKAFKPKPAEQK
ncbi:MAG TPA: site-2 protease family protein [Trichormus sp.]